MAQIEMRITAMDAEDLRKTLALLAGASTIPLSHAAAAAIPATITGAVESVSDSGTGTEAGSAGTGDTTSTRRTRRTKEQIAADEAAAAGNANDPFADQVRQSAAEVAPAVTLDMIRSLGSKYMDQADGNTVTALLEKHGSAKSFKTLDPSTYSAVYEALQEVVKV